MFKRKYSITLINESWEQIKTTIKLAHIPRKDELIYLEEFEKYFKVINVIHNITKKHGIFLVIQEYLEKKV
jgi:hypothetical protein